MSESERSETVGTYPAPARVVVLALGRLRRVDVTAVAAETAYFAMLAIAPFFIFLVAGIGFLSQFVPVALVDDLERTVVRMAPGGTGELLAPLFEEAIERSDAGTISFGIAGSVLVALWSGSRAIGGLLKGFRRIRGLEVDPPLVWNRAISLLLASVLGSVLLLSIAVFLFGGAVGRGIASLIGLGDTFSVIWRVASWPLLAFVVVIVLAVLYRFGMNNSGNGFRVFTAGSVTGAIMWLVIMLGIRVYLAFIDVGSIYGVLGSLMILVVFFYVMSLALLFGAAVDAIRVHESNSDTREDVQSSA